MVFSIVFWVVVIIITVCDFSPLTLDEKSSRLLYSDEVLSDDSNTGDSIFGDSTITSKVDENDLADDDARKQAEDLIKQIYGG